MDINGTTFRGDSTFVPNASTARTQRAGGTPSSVDTTTTEDFIIRGETYKRLECLSGNTGEAQVYLVEKDGEKMVLKIYYPNFKHKKEVTKIIMNMRFEMIIRIMDFGKLYLDGAHRDYELMEYLEGGTLDKYKINGDINKFRRIALQAAAALKYCHNKNIIHKDIKPGNFFFRNKDEKELVLSDFGISSVLNEGETLHRTTQARTPIYASPEMYTDVIDGVVEIGYATDYYSLGLTLLTLWFGHSPFSVGERTIMRQKNDGRIPGIDSLPDRVKLLIRGLMTVNPSTRWKYEQVESWFKGETPAVDTKSPFLKYKTFVVDPDRNLVAENVEELIPMLLDNERIAVGYLYSGSLAAWFEQCGNGKVALALRDIVKNKYPHEQHSGLMAAIYAMDPLYPYTDVEGQECQDEHSVAATILIHSKEYSLKLQNPYDDLWVYVESHFDCDITRMRNYFSGSHDEDKSIAIQRTAYEIDTDLPFIVNQQSSTLQEVVECFGRGNVTENEWRSLTDGRFLSWMYGHADKAACEALRITTAGQEYSRQLAYKVLYDVDRDAAYDLRGANTPKKVGQLLSEDMIKWQDISDGDFAEKISDFSDPNGRFAYYAHLHGWSAEYEQQKRCFDFESEENRDRLGDYDLRTAAYRFCRILGTTPQYVLPSGKVLKDGDVSDRRNFSEMRAEIKGGSLKQWIAVFHHENPENDFHEEYSYERALEQWLLTIGEIDPQQQYYRRFIKAKQEIKQKHDDFQTMYYKVQGRADLWKIICGALLILWIVLVLICGISGRDYLLANGVITICGPVGFMTAVIFGLRAFYYGYGEFLILTWGVLGFLTSLIPLWLLRTVHTSMPGFFIPTVIILSILYYVICIFTDGKKKKGNNDNEVLSDLLDDDVKTSLLEPLYYTFKTKSEKFRGSKFGVLENVSEHFTSVANDTFVHYLLWSILIMLLVAEMIIYSPKLLNVDNPTSGFFKTTRTEVVK